MENFNHQPIAQILEEGKEYIQSCVDKYIVFHAKQVEALAAKGKVLTPLTEYGIECYRLSIQYDLIKAMSNYLLNTDKLISTRFGFGAKGVEISIVLERNGQREYLDTDVIVAEGPIQQVHYRYLVKTNLYKLGVDLTKSLRGIDKAIENVKYYEEVVERYTRQLNDATNMDFVSWLPVYSYHFRECAKQCKTHAEYIIEKPYMADLFTNEFAKFKSDDNKKYNAYLLKGANKDLAKKQDKLAALRAAL